MGFPGQLTSDELDALRGTSSVNPTYYASDLVIFCPNVVVFQARVSVTATGGSYAQVSFGTVTVGAYTDIKVGQTILISSTSDKRSAKFTGIVRKAPTSSIAYINETSVPLNSGDYIWVINDYRLSDKLARQVGNTQYKFYDIPYQTTPPAVYNLQSAYAGIADTVTGKLELFFQAAALAITSGATISSWLWTIPSGITIISGSTTTQTITVDVDAGTADWVTLRVRDSNSHDGFFHFFVAAVPYDLSSVITPAVNAITFSCNENGWAGSVTAFDGVDDILDNTLCVVLSNETYNEEVANINGNVKFVGRIRKENDQTQTDATAGVVEQLTYDLEGALAQFSRIEHLNFTLRRAASPTVWDELANLTIWRAIAYTLFWHTNYLELFSVIFDNTTNTYAYPLLPTQGGNILAVINDLAVSLDATIESAATGETRIHRNALYQTTAERNALVTVINYGDQDWIDFTLEVNEVDTAGKVQASGGYFNAASGNVTALLSLAPGIAQGTGADITNLTRQVLANTTSQSAAQAELNRRSGAHYAIVQSAQPVITVTHPDGYTFITPSLSLWYTFTIAASENTGGRAYTTADRWQCISYSISHDSALGTNDIQAVYRLECFGTPGQTVTYPAPGQVPPSIPTVPSVPAYPSFPPIPNINLPPIPAPADTPPYTPPILIPNGNIIGLISDIDVWNTQNALTTSSPTYQDISPGAETFTCFQWAGLGFKGAYCISNNGTDSTFYYSEDATIPAPVWVGTALTGIYTTIRTTSTPGKVYIGGLQLVSNPADSWGIGTFGGGTITSRTDTTITVDSTNVSGSRQQINLMTSGDNVCSSVTVHVDSGGYGDFVDWIVCGLPQIIGNISFGFLNGECCNTVLAFTDVTGPFTMTFTFVASDDCGTPSTSIVTRYSTDFGATFASPVSVGTSANGIVMDTVKVGGTILVATDGQIMKAVDGGAYSAYGDPLPAGFATQALWIPWRQFNSTTTVNSSTNPQYIIVANAVDSASASVYVVTASGVTFTDRTPTHSGNPGLAVSSDCVAMSFKTGKKIVGVFSFSGTRRLQVSSNGGASWTDRGTVGTGARSARMRRSDVSEKQIAIGNGSTGLLVSQNFGLTLLSKGDPSDDAILLAEFFG